MIIKTFHGYIRGCKSESEKIASCTNSGWKIQDVGLLFAVIIKVNSCTWRMHPRGLSCYA